MMAEDTTDGRFGPDHQDLRKEERAVFPHGSTLELRFSFFQQLLIRMLSDAEILRMHGRLPWPSKQLGWLIPQHRSVGLVHLQVATI